MEVYENLFDFHISFFLVFNRDFVVIFIDFTHVAASNTANNDVTN